MTRDKSQAALGESITGGENWEAMLCRSEKLDSGVVGSSLLEAQTSLGVGRVHTESKISACKSTGSSQNSSLSVTSLCVSVKPIHDFYKTVTSSKPAIATLLRPYPEYLGVILFG